MTDIADRLRALYATHPIVTEAADEIELLRAALQAILTVTDEEIAVRFRTDSHKTEEQIAGKSVIYSLLAVPRNIARAALE